MKYKNKHFIPRFYLKKWSFNGGHQVYCLKKSIGKIFCPSVGKICAEQNIWNDNTESRFSALETKWNEILDKILDKRSVQCLNNEEKKQFCSFVSSTVARTPQIIKPALKKATAVLDEPILTNFGEIKVSDMMDKESILTEITINCFSDEKVDGLLGEAYRQMNSMIWGIRNIPLLEGSFITSDNPYSVISFQKKILDLVVLPLSPKCLFFMAKTYPTSKNLNLLLPSYIVPLVNTHIAKQSNYIIATSEQELENIKNSI